MTNKGAVIIGGSGGLGSAVVRAFHGRGWKVAFSHSSSPDAAVQLADELGSSVFTARADITAPREIAVFADLIRQRWGDLQVLVNCAGTVRDALLPRQTEEEWDTVLAVNLTGVFNVIRAFAPLMSPGGHFVNISSLSGLRGRQGQAAYSAAKAALTGLTTSAARELASLGIRVNAVAPGYMATAMGADAPGAMGAAIQESLLSRLCDPDDVAGFIVYLASTQSVTGQIFCIDSRIV